MINKSKELYKGQRSREKSELYRRFKHRAIVDVYKDKLFAIFNHRCFKCGAKDKLDIDHHVPMILGGHLIEGNLVALCKTCNNKKHDRPPEVFYTTEELKKLEPLLEKQSNIFKFKFDRNYWHRDRQGYLISLGVEPSLVYELLNNPNHEYYIGPAAPQTSYEVISVSIIADISDLIDTLVQENPSKNIESNKKPS